MNVHFGQEPVFVGEAPDPAHTEHSSITVDEGRVRIDGDDDHVIRVTHDKSNGTDVLRAIDRATSNITMRIDSDGQVVCPDVRYKDEAGADKQLQALDTSATASQATLNAASAADNVQSNLVSRSVTSGTEIANLHVEARPSGYTKSFPPAGLYFTAATGRGELNIIEDGRMRFQPYDVDGTALMDRTFSFGRAVPESGETDITADARRDGLLLEDATLDQSAELMVSNQLPTLRLTGSKQVVQVGGHNEPMCPVIDVQDGDEISRFAVYHDGFVVQSGHQDTNTDSLHSAHFHSVIAGDNSVYIGSCRISYDRAAKTVLIRRLKEQVPAYLVALGVQGPPTGHTLASMTVHAWVAYARTSQNNVRLQVQDVFPDANTDDWEAATIGAVNTRLSTLEGGMQTAEGRLTALESNPAGLTAPPKRLCVYVDAGYSGENGNADGSLLKPYTTLQAACSAELTEGSTQHITFKLAPGAYTGTINITQQTASQHFCVKGSGPDVTFIQAGTTYANANANDAVFLRRFKDVQFKDCTIRNSKGYGLYIRDCTSCTFENVYFRHCGSDGTANRHDLSGTQAEQAAFWQSASTSNGGPCRVRSCDQVSITGCHVDLCLRGLRIQDCGTAEKASLIEGNRISRSLESGVYLASGSYDGGSGCVNFKVSSNIVHESFNNGILVIGGSHNSVVGNTISGCANAAIQLWDVVDTETVGNICRRCNIKAYNGIGNNGDAHAVIDCVGASNIRAGGSYAAVITGNVILNCGTGFDPNTNIGVRVHDHANRPASSQRVAVQGNQMSDVAVRVSNTAGLTEVSTADASGGGGAGATHVTDLQDVTHAGSGSIITAAERAQLGTLQSDVTTLQATQSDLVVRNTTGSASVKIESNTDAQTGKSSLTFFSNSNNDGNDRTWEMRTDAGSSDALVLSCQSTNFGTREAFRFNPAGAVSFGAGGNAITNLNVAGFQVRTSAWFRNTLRTTGDIFLDAGATVRRGDANGEDLLAGGGTSTTNRFDVVANGNVSGDIQLAATDRNLLWIKQRGTLGHGSLAVYKMPPSADIEDGHTIQFHGFSKSWTAANESMSGGSIKLKVNTGQTFGDPNRYLYWDTDISGTAAELTVSHLYRRTIWAIWDETDSQWWVKGSDSIDRHNYVKHFDYTSNAHETEATLFQLPQGFKFYYISMGEGLNAVSGTHKHVYFRPPGNAAVGTRIEVNYLMPTATNTSKLYWVDNANQDSTHNGAVISPTPWFFTQTGGGRRRHLMIKVSGTRWTQLRTM